MKIKILLFAHLKEILGSDVLELDLVQGAKGEDVIKALEEINPEVAHHKSYLKLSMNGEYITKDTEIIDQAEIAVFPPVSGG